MRRIPYPTPGEILLEEFLKPMGITQYRLAKEIAEAAAMAGYVRNWSAVLYGTGADKAAYHVMVDTLYPAK